MKKLRSFVPRMDIVGLPDAAVQESKQRVQATIKNSGFDYLYLLL
jgi:magnesium chelatase family protein